MWQRIQTLYLAIATGLIITLFFSVRCFSIGQGGAHVDELRYTQFVPYLVLLVVIALLPVLALFTYNVRVFQMRTAILSAILLLALQAWLAVEYFTVDGVVFKFTVVFPLVAAGFDALAARNIFRDQLLVESISHLRSKKKNRKV